MGLPLEGAGTEAGTCGWDEGGQLRLDGCPGAGAEALSSWVAVETGVVGVDSVDGLAEPAQDGDEQEATHDHDRGGDKLARGELERGGGGGGVLGEEGGGGGGGDEGKGEGSSGEDGEEVKEKESGKTW